MYHIFVALAIGLILLNLVWQLFKNFGLAMGTEAEDELSAKICAGLGGKKNISDVDCCATRLRVSVAKPELVDEAKLKESGAKPSLRSGTPLRGWASTVCIHLMWIRSCSILLFAAKKPPKF